MTTNRRWSPQFIIPLIAMVVGLLVLLFLTTVLDRTWPLAAICATDPCKEAREWVSSTITVIVIVAGLGQYWQAQQWKRAEFVADEMKSFFAQTGVRKAMVMIDWGTRNINLFENDSTDPKTWPLVSRRLQSDALLPHPLRKERGGAVDAVQAEAVDSDLAGFSFEEVAIRDAFDAFLDGLERFASHVENGLLAPRDLRPYLGYWIDDIARPTNDAADGEWACSLLAYIAFYRYTGVRALFQAFGHDITPEGALFAGFLRQVADRSRAEQFVELFSRTAAQARSLSQD